MKHGALFNGIGGFQLAAEWMGWENAFSCEIDEFCNKVTKYHFPNCIQYGDINTTDFTIWRNRIDIITGGFPCQPYSQAGKRLGKEDERHLWPQMLRAIREIQPKWVVGENVLGIVNWNGGLVFDEVQSDLEAAGYEVQPYVLPACGKDAPHRRDRVWFVAHTDSNVHERTLDTSADCRKAETSERKNEQPKGWNENGERIWVKSRTSNENDPNTTSIRLEGRAHKWEDFRTKAFGENRNWRYLSKPTVCIGDHGISIGLDTTAISFIDWRNESLKAAGNAIVPQVAFEIFKAIQQYQNMAA